MAINPTTGREEDDGAGGAGGVAPPMGAIYGTGYAPDTSLNGPEGNFFTNPGTADALRAVRGEITSGMRDVGSGPPGLSPAATEQRLAAGEAARAAPEEAAAGGAAPVPPPPSIPGAPAAPVDFQPIKKAALIKTGSQTTTTREVATKKEGQLERELERDRAKIDATAAKLENIDPEKALAARAGAEKVGEAEVIAEQQGTQADIVKARANEQALVAAREQEKIAAAQKLSDEEKKRYDGVKDVSSLWSTRTTGQKAAIMLGIALGGIGAAISGDKRNAALDQYNTMVQQDFALQKAKIEQQRQKWVDSRVPVEDANKARDAALLDLDHKYAALTERNLQTAKARLAVRGVPAAQIESDMLIQKLSREAQQADLARKERTMSWVQQDLAREAALRTKVQSTTTHEMREGGPGIGNAAYVSEVTGKPATDVERNSDSFAERMANQLATVKAAGPISDTGRKVIRDYLVRQTALERSPTANAAAVMLGLNKNLESRLNDNDRAAFQAIREFTAANLRKESGAAISAGETQQAFERFAPLQGEKPADIARKQRAMQDVALQAAKGSYRPTYWERQIRGGGSPGSGTAPAQPQPVQVRNKRTGAIETAYKMPDGSLVTAAEAMAAR